MWKPDIKWNPLDELTVKSNTNKHNYNKLIIKFLDDPFYIYFLKWIIELISIKLNIINRIYMVIDHLIYWKIGIVIISFKNLRSSTNAAENHMKSILSVCVMNNIKYRKMIIFDILNERFLLLNSNSIYVPLIAALYTLTYKNLWLTRHDISK